MEGVRKVYIDMERFKPPRKDVPAERAEPLKSGPDKIIPARRIRTGTIGEPSKELAYCHGCRADRPMLWKAPELRGGSVDSWFVCAGCGGDDLTFKLLSYEEAVAKNRRNADDEAVPF